MKLTKWFQGHIKPVRKGVYQQYSGSGHKIGYQLWDGKKWRAWTETAESAEQQITFASPSSQNDEWRGIAK